MTVLVNGENYAIVAKIKKFTNARWRFLSSYVMKCCYPVIFAAFKSFLGELDINGVARDQPVKKLLRHRPGLL